MEEPATLNKVVKIIYILNFVGVILPLCTLVGVILAYIFQEDASGYLKSHFQYQIRGFWISLLYYLISGLLCLVVVGFALLFLTLVWWIIRNAKGLKLALNEKKVADPTTWLF